MTAACILALVLLAPPDGAEVALLKSGQRDVLARPEAEILAGLDDAATRRALFEIGGEAEPVVLKWDGAAPGPVTLTLASSDDRTSTFVLTNMTSARLGNFKLGARYRWTVTDSAGATACASFLTEPEAPRVLTADGVGNFRDFGGWKTTDGHRVREGLVLRSAGLRSSSRQIGGSAFQPRYEIGPRRVTPAGLRTLRDEFGIRTDLELRSRQETAGFGGSLIPGAKWVHEPAAAYGFADSLVRGKEPFAKIFHVFANTNSYPVLVHCSGGRDRTGTLAFLLLGLLGVAEEDLVRDWAFSAFGDEGPKFRSARIRELIERLSTYPGDTLQKRIAAYVHSCGVTDEEVASFRKMMLED